jgi:hypothetical protein
MQAHLHHDSHRHPSTTGDVLGQALSLLCLVHCMATPLLLMLAPTLAGFLGGWHPVLLGGVVLTAAWAFVPGYRYHRSKAVLALAGAGVALLAIGVLAFHDHFALETAMTVTGAGMMLSAHWKNRQLSATCPR